jgi:hypothetical protein
VTKKTLKRFLKSLGYTYKRARAKITKCDRATCKSQKNKIIKDILEAKKESENPKNVIILQQKK